MPVHLPPMAASACEQLRVRLLDVLGDELVGLWAYGAATFPDPPRHLGDIDTHGLLRTAPDAATVAAIDTAHADTAEQAGIEWDSWYILAADASSASIPPHAFRPYMADTAWALHRAHWLAGQVVVLHGPGPDAIVPPPSWDELLEGLRYEVLFIKGYADQGRDDVHHTAFSVANLCRVACSLTTRDVVISKRAASVWALEHFDPRWHEAVVAAHRVYDGEVRPDDEALLRAAVPGLLAHVTDLI